MPRIVHILLFIFVSLPLNITLGTLFWCKINMPGSYAADNFLSNGFRIVFPNFCKGLSTHTQIGGKMGYRDAVVDIRVLLNEP